MDHPGVAGRAADGAYKLSSVGDVDRVISRHPTVSAKRPGGARAPVIFHRESGYEAASQALSFAADIRPILGARLEGAQHLEVGLGDLWPAHQGVMSLDTSFDQLCS